MDMAGDCGALCGTIVEGTDPSRRTPASRRTASETSSVGEDPSVSATSLATAMRPPLARLWSIDT